MSVSLPECPSWQVRALKYVLILEIVMPKFTNFFGMTFAKNMTYGVPKFAETEINQHSGNLKDLSGYLQTFTCIRRPFADRIATFTSTLSIAF